MKVGGPAAGEYVFYSLSQIVVTYIVTNLGAKAINTRIYIQNITSYVNITSFSIGQGTQILMGYMKGAGKIDDMHKTCIKGLKIAVLSNFLLASIFYILGRQFIGIYSSDTSIIEIGKNILFLDIFLEIGRAFNHTVGNALRGTGDVRYPVVISIISMWCICVLLSLVLGVNFKFGLVGIWIASGLDEWFRGLVLLKRWYSKLWMRIQLV
jgi:Na+-driven multidrug efflux pump